MESKDVPQAPSVYSGSKKVQGQRKMSAARRVLSNGQNRA